MDGNGAETGPLSPKKPASPYQGERAALATMHGKAAALERPFRAGLGLALWVPEGLDTDQLGTFTGEVNRVGDPRAVAVKKARLGMETAGLEYGLASEGSFGPHPLAPFLQGHHEYLAFVDGRRDFVVVESFYSGKTNFGRTCCGSWREAAAFAGAHGFPAHGLVVRPGGAPDLDGPERELEMVKGIQCPRELENAVRTALEKSPARRVWVETDMRAHQNPTRMRALRALAFRLVRRMRRLCPACRCPGFGLVALEAGLPCEACGLPTGMAGAEVHGCPLCPETVREPRADGLRKAPAGECERCNP